MFKCEICNKGSLSGNKLNYKGSQLTKRVKKTRLPNIQKVRVLVDGTPMRQYVCTNCLKSNRVVRAI
jgi:large subunit ribosomal protein L28